jgi:hypothetical protein
VTLEIRDLGLEPRVVGNDLVHRPQYRNRGAMGSTDPYPFEVGRPSACGTRIIIIGDHHRKPSPRPFVTVAGPLRRGLHSRHT